MVVKKIFSWVGIDGYSSGKVCRLLKEQNILTRTGRNNWDHSVICCLLKNPAYIGKAAFGKTYIGKMQPRLRPYHGCSEQPKKAYSTFQNPKEKWISIPVPAIVEKKLFDAANEILIKNRTRYRESKRGAKYLLQGLLVCSKCGYSLCGISPSYINGKPRTYGYYRCAGTEPARFGGNKVCENTPVGQTL